MRLVSIFKIIALIGLLAVKPQAFAQNKVLTLEDCRRMALENNNTIKSAQFDLDASKAASKSVKSGALPTLDASLTGAHFGDPLTQYLPSVLANVGIDVKQTIYSGGKVRYNKQAAEKNVEVYDSQKIMTQTEILLEMEQDYWQVVQAKEKIALALKYKERLQSLKIDLKNQVDAGLTYKNDLLRAEVNLNQAELDIIKANDALVLSMLNLAQVIGQPGNIDFSVTDQVNGDFEPIMDWPAESLSEKRPEIDILKKSIEAEQIQSKVIRADIKPQIALSLSGIGSFGKDVNFSNGSNNLATYYSLLTLNVPIFDWGKNANKVKEQNFKIESKKADLEQNKELITIEIQNAYLQLNQSHKKINLTKASLAQAEENLRLASDRYKAGTIIGKDVLEAQVIWQEAYTDIIEAKIEYKINLAGYKKAIGELK
ncbi:TolC family protein [Flavobacterium sp. CSZ]|uniref:TolC family protein n=1 Tax=Flavobacterium sp. CSZ TaxID=2783791 RepID=UPI00188AA4CC|nr:TolC family protein [Flavobacterium sp. CSZ]MBF4485725.1 TolC family protein [Flavobacterium sp. CSZ]